MKPYAPSRPGLVKNPADTITAVLLSTTGQAFDVPTGACSFEYTGSIAAQIAIGSTSASFPNATSTSKSTEGFYALPGASRNFGSTASCTGISILSSAAGNGTIQWWGAGG